MKTRNRIYRIAILCGFCFFLANCAKPKFSAQDKPVVSVQDPAVDPSTLPVATDPNAAAGTIHQGANELPTAIFVGPPCTRGTACAAGFQISKAMPMTFSFDWRTNDLLYRSPAPAGQPAYGQPNVHYVPKSGSVSLAPGETARAISIQNINPYNIAIVIGVLMTNCKYGDLPADCSKIFQ